MKWNGSESMLGIILIVILVLALFGALPRWSHSRSWGYLPSGGLGLVLIIGLVLPCGFVAQAVSFWRPLCNYELYRPSFFFRACETAFSEFRITTFLSSASLTHSSKAATILSLTDHCFQDKPAAAPKVTRSFS